MEAILEPIINSPRLCLYFNELGNIIEDEKKLRDKFYNEITEQQKAEFINGKIIMQSPAKFEHNQTGKLLLKLLDSYVSINKLGWVGYEKVLICLTRNDYEPDICFFGNPKASNFKKGQMKFPAPDFVVEIVSPSTENVDRGIKFNDYAAHGVLEYWIIDADEEIIEQYMLDNKQYILNQKSGNGVIKSFSVKGFEIPVESIFNEELNSRVLRDIINK